MTRSRARFSCAILLALTSTLMAGMQAAAEAPPTPTMPANWTLVSDVDFGAPAIRPVSARLGAEISALRNTTYDVEGSRVKLNTIVAASPTDADAVMRALAGMKPREWFLRRGLVIYEFVGPNESIPEMRAARALLTAQSPAKPR